MIPKRFRPFDPSRGPWLIWSYYHNAWHCRSSEGGAAGYTCEIDRAGVFDERVARAHHDTGPRKWRRDVSIPARKAAGALRHRLEQKRAEAEAIERTIASLSASPLPTPSETPRKDGEG